MRSVAGPLVTMGGRSVRPRPIIPVTIMGPSGNWPLHALVDTGADESLFPDHFASVIGIDLSTALASSGTGLGSGSLPLRFAEVTLNISDTRETREWRAWVSFTSAFLSMPLLGFAGFLQYFTATFHGDREELELTVNASYPGT